MNNFKWYMISTVRGKEKQVLESLNNRIVAENLTHDFDLNAIQDTGAFKMFLRPSLTAKENEKRLNGLDYTTSYINLYPGYIFVKMHMSDPAWFLIRNTQYVTGLVGSSGKGAKPTPVSSLEIKKMFKKEEQAAIDFQSGENNFGYTKGDILEIIEGSYKGWNGIVNSVNHKNKTIIMTVEKYGQKIEVEINITSVRFAENE